MSVNVKKISICNYLLILTLLASCSSKKSPEEVTKELENVSSWAATAHMVGDAWIRNAVPTTYAQQTLKKTEDELQQETEKLSKLSTSSAQQRTLLEPLQRLKSIVGQMSAAVEKKDRKALTTGLKELSTQQQTIHRLAKPTGEKP